MPIMIANNMICEIGVQNVESFWMSGRKITKHIKFHSKGQIETNLILFSLYKVKWDVISHNETAAVDDLWSFYARSMIEGYQVSS